ncbi:type IV secretion system DNA-binding domain-containing protein [Candidatus Parcubacteria bacterium]|nr:type IV secretion system DNA-binding domain-containing protein [Candidatus Parcubacteria bacterium]
MTNTNNQNSKLNPAGFAEGDDITFFAETNFRNRREKFGIKTDDRRRHMYLIGKTGMGKTTMLENMVYQDIIAGHGVALVDPHGDLVEKILDFIPKSRINDVVYFNPGDIHNPIAFNVLESLNPDTRHIAASGLIGIFKKLWADSWGPRLEYLLRNAILALMDSKDTTILGIMRMLANKEFRKKVVSKIQDPIVRSFWVDEYSKYTGSFQVEAINPIQNKVGQFSSTPLIRNIIGQVKSSINIRDIMDNKKILLMNLSKGRIGEDASALLGAMMITKIQLAAMERVNVPEEERKDFYLYVDEFQNFATESFASILSEARKYRLNLIVANQYIEQLDEKVIPAIFGNVGTIISFRIGPIDAETIVKEFTPTVEEDNLVNLNKFDVYLKLMINGVASEAFSATGLPPLAKHEGNTEKIIKISREKHSVPREIVEDKILKWTQADNSPKNDQGKNNSSAVKGDKKRGDSGAQIKDSKKIRDNSDKKEFNIQCSYCGDDTKVSFEPDGKRPVFCKRCLKKLRDKEMKVEKNPDGEYVIIENTDERSLELEEKIKQNLSKDKSLENVKNSADVKLTKDDSVEILQKKYDRTVLKQGQKIKF